MSADLPLSIYDSAALEAFARARRIDRVRVRRLRNAFLKWQRGREAALAELEEGDRAALAEAFDFHPLTLATRSDSGLDGASKLVFRNRAGDLLETVLLRIASGRTAVCVSSQVGCAAACAFCATGQMGVARSLSTGEILDQVVQAGELLRGEERRIRNVVFMGMGEPLHNEEAVAAAVELLVSPEHFNLSPKQVMVSTVGVTEPLLRFAERFPRVSLALSLHSARQEVRERLIPLARRYSLAELRAALEAICAGGRRVMIEYLLLAGVNDAADDAEALIEYLAGLPVHINLIPYNPIAAAPDLAASEPRRQRTFQWQLQRAGYHVTIRHSLGSDIAAACGQLVQDFRRREVAKNL